MQRKLVLKLLAIGLLSFLLLIPLAMIESQIAQRSYRQDDVTRNIAESAAGEQTLIVPVPAGTNQDVSFEETFTYVTDEVRRARDPEI